MFTPILVAYPGSPDKPHGNVHTHSDVPSPTHAHGPGVTGAIQSVAEEIALTLRTQGLETDVRDLGAISSLEPYRAVVLGAGFVAGAWQRAAREFMSCYREELIALPVAVFALAPSLPDPMDSGGRRVLLEELAQYRWLHPIAAEVFRVDGALHATEHPTEVALLNGSSHGTPTGTVGMKPDAGTAGHEDVLAWAHLVARLLIPAPTR